MKGRLVAAVATTVLLGWAGLGQAQMISTNLTNASRGGGTSASANLTLDNSGTNTITATVDGLNPIADIRGVFFNVADDPGLMLSDISGTNTTDKDTNVGSGSGLGGGTNTGPNGDYDFGVEIGTAGIGSDDIQSTTINFDTSGNSLTLGSFQDFLVRLQSVGANRNGSSRLVGTPGGPTTPPQPPGNAVSEPGTLGLLALALGLIGVGFTRRGHRFSA